MEVYFGGAFQGKLDYVLKKKGNKGGGRQGL